MTGVCILGRRGRRATERGAQGKMLQSCHTSPRDRKRSCGYGRYMRAQPSRSGSLIEYVGLTTILAMLGLGIAAITAPDAITEPIARWLVTQVTR